MAENKPGPTRVVEEPAGFDNPPTERIPVPGDLSDRRGDARPAEDVRDEPKEDAVEPRDDAGEPRENSVEPRDDWAEPRDDSVERRDDLAEPVTGPVEPVTEPVELAAAPLPAPDTGSARPPAATALFDDGAVDGFRNRWRELQAGFVDDPAQAVRAADELVDEIMRELAERRQSLGEQWRDGPGDTEELRVVIQEYRAFFNQLLNS